MQNVIMGLNVIFNKITGNTQKYTKFAHLFQ